MRAKRVRATARAIDACGRSSVHRAHRIAHSEWTGMYEPACMLLLLLLLSTAAACTRWMHRHA
jgi:hypothetical protein